MNIVNQILEFIFGNVYLKFLFILIVTLIIAYLLKFIFRKVLKPLTKKTETKIDDLIIKSTSSIVFYIVLVLGIKYGLQYFELTTTIYNNLLNTLLVIIVSLLLIRIVNNFFKHWAEEWRHKTKTTTDERIIPLLQKIVKAVIIILAVVFIFSAWNINISPLLATAGIAGLAIGLAVKDSLANILGGLQLVLDKTFKVGDKVELESGEMGVILDIGLRSTKLKTYDNEIIHIPNGALANAKIKNFTQPDFSIRVNVEFGVVYGAEPEKVRQVVVKALKKIGEVLEDPEPVVEFKKMSDFSLDFIARAWVKEYTQAYSTKLRMTDEIYKALNKAKIGIPFPTHTIYTKPAE
ncbi:MAG: mechanosensitive ion channel [Candidatus Aminicenantes bacterium]|nr:mechanosensitive ion channel [Candidatus Aminicenantes bacterium]